MKKTSLFFTLSVIGVMTLLLWSSRVFLTGLAWNNKTTEYMEMLYTLLPGSVSFTEEIVDMQEGSFVKSAYKSEKGYVIEAVSRGYVGEITLLVGVDKAGTVTGLVVRDLEETYGLGAKALTDTVFLSQFLNTSGEAALGKEIDALAGATVTSKAVLQAVNAATAYVTGADTATQATEWGS